MEINLYDYRHARSLSVKQCNKYFVHNVNIVLYGMSRRAIYHVDIIINLPQHGIVYMTLVSFSYSPY